MFPICLAGSPMMMSDAILVARSANGCAIRIHISALVERSAWRVRYDK